MGGIAFDDALPSNEVRNIVLVGKTGNGKSSTGNSILGRRAFESMSSSSGVTTTCQMHKVELEDGQILNVIDTPGLFDSSVEHEFVGEEIVKCISMAKDGIHAVLVVLSVRSRFTKEEAASIQSLRVIFGSKIIDYMIVVFTGGDELEESNMTLDDYFGRVCPKPLKDFLKMCGNRAILFDNKTKDESKKSKQLKQLLVLINDVVQKNGGKPFTNELFIELKIESKLKEEAARLQQRVTEEQAAREKAEAKVQAAQMESQEEIRRLKESLERVRMETEELRLRVRMETEELRRRTERSFFPCAIM